MVEIACNRHQRARKTQTALQASHSSFILLFLVIKVEFEIPIQSLINLLDVIHPVHQQHSFIVLASCGLTQTNKV